MRLSLRKGESTTIYEEICVGGTGGIRHRNQKARLFVFSSPVWKIKKSTLFFVNEFWNISLYEIASQITTHLISDQSLSARIKCLEFLHDLNLQFPNFRNWKTSHKIELCSECFTNYCIDFCKNFVTVI